MINEPLDWLERLRKSPKYLKLKERPIAYFSAEYALLDNLPTFAGGLGILAGDYIREAAEQMIPLLGVGLYYEQGFMHRELSKEGRVVEEHMSRAPEEAGLVLVKNHEGNPLTVEVLVQDHAVKVRAWAWQRGVVTVYLLDTGLSENSESDQRITEQLYVTDKELRLKQELVLGIGGLRILEAMGYHPSFYHLNEGHSAFLIFELIHHEMKAYGLSFEDAKARARTDVLFTNHTLVPAGNDVFSNDLVALLLNAYAVEIQVPIKTLVDLGLVQQSSTFSMTILALRLAGKINAVSKLHAKKAKEIWTNHPMFPITNGIHIASWDKIGTQEIWGKHQSQKRLLLQTISAQTGQKWDEGTLLLGWARRMVSYKRPLAILERLKRFAAIISNANNPIRIVFAGLTHPSDNDGAELLEELQFRLNADLKGLAVYLPGYNRELAEKMVSGTDVWINTPIVGFEACGTSGMKAALNGSLPLTTRDGWVDEVDLYKIGWLVGDTNLTDDLLNKLENEIAPLYYSNRAEWVNMMENGRSLILNEFSMTRALKQYLQEGMDITL